MPSASRSKSRSRTLTARKLRALACEKFGFEALHPGQEKAIRSVLKGQDTLAILPTGGGKSAIYQMAGLLLEGLTIVVSPLIALQRDQVESMAANEATPARLLNSTLNAVQREEVLGGVESGKVKFLLLAPEQFGNRETVERLRATKPALFVVDEAHCVSQWGHDFRPDYARLAGVIEELGHPIVLALTATAAPPVRDEICASLELKKPKVVVAGFDRPNIRLEVRRFEACARKMPALVESVAGAARPAIVYAATRDETEEIAQELERAGLSALAYHAGLPKDERDRRQLAFMGGEVEVMVATVAFGMGIDKPNVRRVWHYDVSDSLDSYYQEVGRAGRDSAEAVATLFYCPGDLGLKRFQTAGGKTVAHNAAKVAAIVADLARKGDHPKKERGVVELQTLQDEVNLGATALHRAIMQLENAGALESLPGGAITPTNDLDLRQVQARVEHAQAQTRQWDHSRLEMMRLYAETTDCRRQFLLAYFGENLPEPCGNCDNCLHNQHQEKLKSVQETRGSGRNALVRPAERSADKPATFAVGAHVGHKSWGEGQVLSNDGDKMTVVFDQTGYKTLSVELVEKNHLLEAREP